MSLKINFYIHQYDNHGSSLAGHTETFPFWVNFCKNWLTSTHHHRAGLNRGSQMDRLWEAVSREGCIQKWSHFRLDSLFCPHPCTEAMGKKRDGSLLFLIGPNGFTPLFRSSSMTIIEYKLFCHLTPDCKIRRHSSSFDYFWYTQTSSILASYG